MKQLKMRWLAAAAGLALMGAASGAQAQVIHFAGTSGGCFYTGVTCVTGAVASLGGLTYDASNVPGFDGYTDEYGFLGIGGQYDNFGMFSLTNTTFDYNGWKFLLEVAFTAPPGVSTTNTAKLQGYVTSSSGGIAIHFDTEPVHLEALDGTWFDFTMNELSVSRGTVQSPGVNYASGDIQVTATPEPATVGLMMAGLALMIPVYRRRRST
jgi:hypothetical protein